MCAITSRGTMRAAGGAGWHAWIRCVSNKHPLRPTTSRVQPSVPTQGPRPEWDDMLVFPFFCWPRAGRPLALLSPSPCFTPSLDFLSLLTHSLFSSPIPPTLAICRRFISGDPSLDQHSPPIARLPRNPDPSSDRACRFSDFPWKLRPAPRLAIARLRLKGAHTIVAF
jgi:hypothetical protein